MLLMSNSISKLNYRIEEYLFVFIGELKTRFALHKLYIWSFQFYFPMKTKQLYISPWSYTELQSKFLLYRFKNTSQKESLTHYSTMI